MVVANSMWLSESVSVISELSVSVLVSISSAESASVTSASVADVTITLVVPVVDVVVGGGWVGVSVWSPSEIISSIDISVVVLESINITWLVVLVSPDLVVSVEVGWRWNLPR